jgi:hypothetical protein
MAVALEVEDGIPEWHPAEARRRFEALWRDGLVEPR